MNQCDGCRRGLPIKDGIHSGGGYDKICCTKNRYEETICRKCGAFMLPGKAIEQTYTGIADFPGSEIVTMSPGGGGKLVDCLKCSKCGHSITR